MSHNNGLHIGDLVYYMGDRPELDKRTLYEVVNIRRGIDGAYDWDDITLKGIDGQFCEFDFKING